jgi:hypothetical protein
MRFPYVVLLSACALILVLPLLAQSPNGVINGLVVDPSTRVIVGADVVVVNDETGVRYTTKTNGEGIYVLPNLPPGPYRLQVSKEGFKTIIKPDIVLNLQDALSISFTLPIGASYEAVTVEAGASMINTRDASVSTVIDHTYVENMPLNGRSFQDLILLTPGVVTASPQASQLGINTGVGRSGEFSVNGQRTESNNYTVDGVSANVGAAAGTQTGLTFFGGASGSVPSATALGTTQALVSVDDLQEFRVQSSTYSAEYGRNPGGQFAFETKSGTNLWHGTAYDYSRNGAFGAQDWFNNYFGVKQPALRQNDFGGTFGGPVTIPRLYNGKDKTFFFVSYEGLRLTAPQAATANLVPDAALRTSAPTALQPALNAFPLPNGLDFGDGIAQYIGSWSNPASLDSTSVRFDHLINDKLRLFFRFSDTTSNSATRGTSDRGSTPTENKTVAYALRTYTAGVSSSFSSRLTNDFRLNYSSNGTTDRTVINPFGGSTPVNLVQLSGLGAGATVEFYPCYDGCFHLAQGQQSGAQRQWNFVDTVSVTLGRHQFKFGTDYRRVSPFAIPYNPLVVYFFFDKSEVRTNTLSDIYLEADAPAYPLYTNFSAFAQDEWRVSQRLSLSFGLRWELNPAPGVTQGLRPYTFQGSNPDTVTLAPQGTPLWQTSWYNFAPRLGTVYTLHNAPGWETVVRGGGGVFFDTGQQLGSLGFSGPGFSANTDRAGSFPVPGAIPAIVNPPVPPYNAGSAVAAFHPHLQLPFTLQWNASVEQALSKSQALSISYVGSHASRLLQENIIKPTNNPNTNFYYFLANGLTSDYGALQTQFRRKFNQGLTALASYTWSHCVDYGSSNFVIGYQRGNCDFDVRHNFSAAFSYDLPNVGHNPFASAVLHHWGIDDRFTVRTAFPVTLRGKTLLQPNGQLYNAGVNLVPGQPVYLYGDNCAAVLQGLNQLPPGKGCPGGRAINPLAFASVNSSLGDAPRNFLKGFGAWQMDMAIRREFPIRERLKLQFRAEAFNIFNHPNFGTIQPFFGRSGFGQFTATLASSLGVLSPLYQMGGPRSMQFALKLVF